MERKNDEEATSTASKETHATKGQEALLIMQQPSGPVALFNSCASRMRNTK